MITLPADLETRLAEVAKLRGTTTEQVAVDGLRRMYPEETVSSHKPPVGTLFDFLKPHLGVIDGPNEACSQDTGRQFADGLLEEWQRSQP